MTSIETTMLAWTASAVCQWRRAESLIVAGTLPGSAEGTASRRLPAAAMA
jgi:hypothetical protein